MPLHPSLSFLTYKILLLMDETREQKKLLKAQKRAEKLAKLEAKKVAPPAPTRRVKKPTSKGYDPAEVEGYWSEQWLSKRAFLPSPGRSDGGKRFVMVIPPPNITGCLHIGHAMMISIQDCIVRHRRLNGDEVLYLPGLDHAGISTQSVVLKSMEGEVTREQFMDAALEWSNRYGHRIYDQFNRMGASLDYSRKMFTLDEKVSKSVNTAFCMLYSRGLIYRDTKAVNWCGKLKTTLSDLEINYKNVEGGSYVEVDGGKYMFGILYYVKYHITCDPDVLDVHRLPYVVIATTRPETILGDSAVCINPNDPRFECIDSIFASGKVSDLFNEGHRGVTRTTESNSSRNVENEEIKTERKNKYKMNREVDGDAVERRERLFAINPLTGEVLPIIFDVQAELDFGTGILKVTPCHDPVDFRLGKKHGLAFNKILDESNLITHPMYLGMKRFEARRAVIEELWKRGMLVKEEKHNQVLPFCSRSNDIIETVVKEQWWCNCKGMAQKAIEGVRNKEIAIFPEEAKNVWFKWLENIKDWCLSRQLWWGHRIPAYRVHGSDEWIVAETEEKALEMARKRGHDRIEQDEDVLDTWFSSGLWPFSALGWPEETPDFRRYFPNSLLETGSDILFFWVARMVMLSYELTGTRPFDRIFLHGIVRDAHGRKMSKSLGNVIDPLYVIEGIELGAMIENLHKGNLDQREMRRAADALRRDYPDGIQKCGADALRFTLLSYTNGMKDINLDILRVQGYSRFCNKIWNAYKFVSMSSGLEGISDLSLASDLKPHQRWILSRLNRVIEDQHKHINAFNFMAASQSIYQFFFEFCDVIIEVSKNDGPGSMSILRYVFISIVKILNPFMPFITEEIHSRLCSNTICDYPSILAGDFSNSFEDVMSVVKICRSNEKVVVEDSPYTHYIRCLVRNGLEIVEKLDSSESIGCIRYKILE